MPVIQKKVKTYSNLNKLWISFGILKSIHRKISLYRNYLKNKEGKDSPFFKLKKYKISSLKLLKLLLKNYYHNKVDYAKNKIKKLGKLLKTL